MGGADNKWFDPRAARSDISEIAPMEPNVSSRSTDGPASAPAMATIATELALCRPRAEAGICSGERAAARISAPITVPASPMMERNASVSMKEAL